MAIFLPRTNSLILEVPKTGSKWVRAAIQRTGIPFQQIGPAEWKGHGTLGIHGRDYSFIACFVRCPVDWYRSYWSYRVAKGWHPEVELDRFCEADAFEDFIRKASLLLPGVLTTIYDTYTGPREDPVDFIGKQENLPNDLVTALRMCGEKFDEELILCADRINQSSLRPEYPPELRELVMISEHQAMERHGYWEGNEDSFGLRGILVQYPEDELALRVLAIHTQESHIDTDRAKAERGTPVGLNTRKARILSNFAMYMQAVKGRTADARRLYELALAADDSHPRTLASYGAFLEIVAGDLDGAEKYYLRALKVRPRHSANLARYGLFLDNQRGDVEGALRCYEKAVWIDSDRADVIALLGSLLLRLDRDIERAGRLLKRAIEMDPGNAVAHCNYAYFLSEVQNDDKAAELHYRIAVSAIPLLAEVAFNFALFLHKRNRKGEALEWLQRARTDKNASAEICASLADFCSLARA
jgi:Tfp pilus assembly protein PilF